MIRRRRQGNIIHILKKGHARKKYLIIKSVKGVFGSLEPEPLKKKPGAGAAWKKCQEPEPVEN